jgi:hypothetical protein
MGLTTLCQQPFKPVIDLKIVLVIPTSPRRTDSVRLRRRPIDFFPPRVWRGAALAGVPPASSFSSRHRCRRKRMKTSGSRERLNAPHVHMTSGPYSPNQKSCHTREPFSGAACCHASHAHQTACSPPTQTPCTSKSSSKRTKSACFPVAMEPTNASLPSVRAGVRLAIRTASANGTPTL